MFKILLCTVEPFLAYMLYSGLLYIADTISRSALARYHLTTFIRNICWKRIDVTSEPMIINIDPKNNLNDRNLAKGSKSFIDRFFEKYGHLWHLDERLQWYNTY